MTPFAQFRFWARSGPRAERRAAFTAMAVAAVLLALALVPLAGEREASLDVALPTGAQGAGPASAEEAPTAAKVTPSAGGAADVRGSAAGTSGSVGPAGAVAPRTDSGAVVADGAGVTRGGSREGAAGACAATRATAPGVTAREIRVAFAYPDLAGAVGNAAFDIREDFPEIAEAMADDINKRGGVACGRKVVARTYPVNPVDTNDQQSKCLKMIEDGNFLVISAGAYITPVSMTCFVRNKIVLQQTQVLGYDEAREGYPYLFTALPSTEGAVRNGVLGLAARGFYRKPQFVKLGILQDACLPAANQEITRSLREARVADRDVFRYTLDCALLASSNQISQAVLRMKAEGVSHVMLTASLTNNRNFVSTAAGQNFTPRYAVTDKGNATVPNGASQWDASFNGAIGITSTRNGELNSGLRNARIRECDRILTSRGLRGINNETQDTLAGMVCDAFDLFRRMADASGADVTRARHVQALHRLGVVETSVAGDSIWNKPGKLHGGDYVRAVTWTTACRCWKVQDQTFSPRY